MCQFIASEVWSLRNYRVTFCLKHSIQHIVPGSDMVKIGSNIARDLYSGKDLKSVMLQRYEKIV